LRSKILLPLKFYCCGRRHKEVQREKVQRLAALDARGLPAASICVAPALRGHAAHGLTIAAIDAEVAKRDLGPEFRITILSPNKGEPMSLLSGIGDLLRQYSAGNANNANVEQHFDQVAQSVPQSTLASGLAEAFHSQQTAPFSQMAAQLFANGNSQQQAGVLNGLAATLGPAMIAKFAAGSPNSPLASLLQSGSVTPAQAASVAPADVEALTSHAQSQDPSIVDRVSAIYAQHPVLIKSLGAAALTIAMKKIADSHQA
jgi:hypothetical protein